MRSADRRLRAVVDALEPRVRIQVERALVSLRASVSVDRLERALRARDAFAIHDIAATLPTRLRPALATLQRAFAAGGRSAIAALSNEVSDAMRLTRMRFDRTNPLAVEAAKREWEKVVVEVTKETRAAIRSVVARAFDEGIPPRDAAQLIRPMIGLTTKQAQSVASLRAHLIASGLSRASALTRSKEYANRLIRNRAMTIARTETISASSRGQLAAWDDAVRKGLIGPRSKKVWIVTPDDRLCPRCAPLDGREIVLGGAFVDRSGTTAKAPPLHPNCRCAIGLAPETAAAAPRRRRRAA